MSASLELEIKSLLDQSGDAVTVAGQILAVLEGEEGQMTDENVRCVCRFLLHTGRYSLVIGFVLRHLDQPEFKIPWPYFLDAIALSRAHISSGLAHNLLEGIDTSGQRGEASRSRALDSVVPSMKTERADRRLQLVKDYRRRKADLIQQLATLRTQQLYEKERELLQSLQRMYPQDPDIQREARVHKERYALEILEKHGRMTPELRTAELLREPELDEVRQGLARSLLRTARAYPEMTDDLAIAAAVWEDWDTCLVLLDDVPPTARREWLRVEVLALSGRHLELLQELSRIEKVLSDDPETFFATAYHRAQALWGLGQKHGAIEVLESLMSARPSYRSGLALLEIWRGL